MDPTIWWAFFAASWAISLSPGPGAVAAMSAGVNHGWRRGYWLTLGLILGIWTQLVVVVLGLGMLIASSSVAFSVLKWLGVAYLIYLGVRQWRAPIEAPPAAAAAAGVGGSAVAGVLPVTRWSLVLKGWLINAINPKGTVFMLAVVPQFLDPVAPLLPQYLVIGATLAFTDLVVMAGYTALAAQVLGALRSPRNQRWMNRSFGGLFVAAGVFLATFKRG
jgi:homoserine/homoserine lactone efflux protein